MAISINPLLKGMRGSINKQIVVKQYAHCTVVTKYPDMSRVVLTPLQRKKNALFADAVKYAQSILKDPEKLKEYKMALHPGERVYNHAIRAYMNAKKELDQNPINTEDERRREPVNTEDERRKEPINTEDERRSKPISTEDQERNKLVNMVNNLRIPQRPLRTRRRRLQRNNCHGKGSLFYCFTRHISINALPYG